MNIFNNREIAIGIWLIIFLLFGLIFLLKKKSSRKNIIGLIKTAFHIKIVSLFLAAIAYNVCVLVFLYLVKFWNILLLKDAIIWVFFTAILLIVNSVTSSENEKLFKKILFDNIKLAIIFEFIVNFYSFPLLVELFLIPIASFIILIELVANKDNKNAILVKYLKIFQAIIGFSILGYSIYMIVRDFKNFATFDTLKEFLLIPILIILFIPFIYITVLYATYEQLFVRINIIFKKNIILKKYIKKRIVGYCLLNLNKVKKFSKNMNSLINFNSKNEVDDLFISLNLKK